METQPEGDSGPPLGLVYDERMCTHFDPGEDPHPENPQRIKAVWEKLQAEGIPQRCIVMKAKEAEDRYLLSVHSRKHIEMMRNISSKAFDAKRERLAASFNSIYFNKGSSEAAFLAAGSVLEVAERVAKGELSAAFAIVRPPGHHAEHNEPMGFCLLNNVAVAANFLINERPELGIKKILIVDWDVHHGNGTQKMFWNDPRVLFFSVHRFDDGSFYPGGDDGSYEQVGEGLGAGYNVNVPWEHARCGDADYLAVWDNILIPLGKSFDPDIVLVSAGFDAALGDPLGGCRVTPHGYAMMTKKLLEFAKGRIIFTLEGGYNLESLAKSALACVQVLLEEKPMVDTCEAHPFESTWRVIKAVRKELSAFWPVLSKELPEQLINNSSSYLPELFSTSSSDSDADDNVKPGKEIESETIEDAFIKLQIGEAEHCENINSVECQSNLSCLSVDEADSSSAQISDNPLSWRSALSKIYVWYACYGSNMWKPRFMCYIEGGQVPGMQRPCTGSKDKRPPKDNMWITVPHRLFFGRSGGHTWGQGGVAFLHPESNPNDKTHRCLYKITLAQFNDVLFQENRSRYNGNEALVDLPFIASIAAKKFKPLEPLEDGWYRNVLFLGILHDLPILTMTCSLADIEGFKSGKIPLLPPPLAYRDCLVQGLVEGKQLSQADAVSYIHLSASLSL